MPIPVRLSTQTQTWLHSASRLQTTLCSQKMNSFWLRKIKIFGTLPWPVTLPWTCDLDSTISYYHTKFGDCKPNRERTFCLVTRLNFGQLRHRHPDLIPIAMTLTCPFDLDRIIGYYPTKFSNCKPNSPRDRVFCLVTFCLVWILGKWQTSRHPESDAY